MSAVLTPASTPQTLSEAELRYLYQNLHTLSRTEQEEILKIAEELERRRHAERCRNDLIAFCKHMQPDYKVGKHHRILANLLMEIADGKKDRICVNIPPRHGKSQLVSIYFPAWFLGKHPDKKVLMVSHTTDLAVDFGRKVRNIIDSDAYRSVFPTVSLAADSKSAGRWNTGVGGEYYACGVGSALAGRGADLLLVDDPHSEQDVLNGNFEVFDKAYEWFTYGARTRLMPGGRVAVVQCMVGDTPVLLAGGVQKPLQDIRPGDMVASYSSGDLVSRRVLNWQSSGLDSVYTIKTTCGKVVQANARHPFLVWQLEGTTTWVQLQNLKPGDSLVLLRGALDPQTPKPDPGYVKLAKPESGTTENTQMPPAVQWGIGASTGVSNAKRRGVRLLHLVRGLKGIVGFAIQSIIGQILGKPSSFQNRYATGTSNTATAFRWRNTMRWLPDNRGSVPSVNSPQPAATQGHTGETNSVWTIATKTTACGRSYVTTVTSQSVTPKHLRLPEPWPNTSTFTTTQIESITPSGVAEVFDIEVEGTENFIANTLVSSNTRWHMDDLTGRLTRDMGQNEFADQYEVVEFPALFEVEDKETGELVQKPLWPEFFDVDALLRTKASMPVFQWNSQYQQQPTAEEGALVKREWWKIWEAEKPPQCEYLIMTLDAAAEKGNRSDFTAVTTWGVFYHEPDNSNQIILLNAIKDRVEFPELKIMAQEEYDYWKPDAFIVEKKSSGTPLYQELRRTGMIIQEYTPHRGTGDKFARLNSVADIIKSGLVWVPQTRWAEELVEEVAGFPFMSHDDLVDTTVMALMRFRQGGFLRLATDEPEPKKQFKSRRGGMSKYY